MLEATDAISLSGLAIPENVDNGLWKCRITYAETIENVEFSPYFPQIAGTFKLVDANITYPHKFSNRDEIDLLFSQRAEAEDIIIVVDGLITDSSNANLIFYDGLQWVTPSHPLLPGTMRAKLLDSEKIQEKEISRNDLFKYEKFMPVNALNPFDTSRALSIERIIL